MKNNILIYFLTGVLISCYFFPFGLTFLPEALNSKNICGFLGVICLVANLFQWRSVKVDKRFFGAIVIVVLYSLIGYISTDINNTYDYSYANYFVSFSIWTLGAYFVCTLIKKVHGTVNIRLLTYYLASIGAAQCVLALLITLVPPFKFVVDLYIEMGQGFLDEIGRWYGIGAALDPAGVRFCIILILIAALIVEDPVVSKSSRQVSLLLVAFFIIVAIGNIISRTTTVGAVMAVVYLVFARSSLTVNISFKTIKFFFILGGILLVLGVVSVYLYQSSETFNDNFRYGFEGFFNWVETGEWTTASTEKLDREMWIWPEDTRTWIIGSGLFDGWVYGTDIGYCRLILYNGLIGFSVFSFLFVYSSVIFSAIYKEYAKAFFLLLCLSFVIWIKVSTDIYQIWALLYCMLHLSPENENRLLHK